MKHIKTTGTERIQCNTVASSRNAHTLTSSTTPRACYLFARRQLFYGSSMSSETLNGEEVLSLYVNPQIFLPDFNPTWSFPTGFYSILHIKFHINAVSVSCDNLLLHLRIYSPICPPPPSI